MPARKPAAKAPAKMFSPGSAGPSTQFTAVIAAFAKDKAVTTAKMFGANCLKIGPKGFAMEYKGNLVVKLPRERVDALAKQGIGEAFDPGMGRVMKEWIAVSPAQEKQWVALSKEAKDFVAKAL